MASMQIKSQAKTTHYTSIRMAEIKTPTIHKATSQIAELLARPQTLLGMQNGTANLRNSLTILIRLKLHYFVCHILHTVHT